MLDDIYGWLGSPTRMHLYNNILCPSWEMRTRYTKHMCDVFMALPGFVSLDSRDMWGATHYSLKQFLELAASKYYDFPIFNYK